MPVMEDSIMTTTKTASGIFDLFDINFFDLIKRQITENNNPAVNRVSDFQIGNGGNVSSGEIKIFAYRNT
jgi:hypothetical protein